MKKEKGGSMRKLTQAIGLAGLLGGVVSGASAANVNIPLVDQAWTLVGAASGYLDSSSLGSSYPAFTTGGSYAILTDMVDDNGTITWDRNVSNGTSPTALSNTGLTSLGTGNGIEDPQEVLNVNHTAGVTGSPLYGTIGIIGINGEHGGLPYKGHVTINWEREAKYGTSPMRTLFIQSPNATEPDVAVYYQATYEGDTFKIVFDGQYVDSPDTTNTYYTGTFSRSFTYDNPMQLGDYTQLTQSSSGTSAGITAIPYLIDMNLTDNYTVPTGTAVNNCAIETNTTTEGGCRAILDGNLTMYTWNSDLQKWALFRASASGTGASWIDANGTSFTNTAAFLAGNTNDFNDIEPGRAYWAKMQVNENTALGITYNNALNPAGLVMGGTTPTASTFSATSSYDGGGAVANEGWNMLTFGDEVIRYTTTGLTFNMNTATNNDINITDSFGAQVLGVVPKDTDVLTSDVCQAINDAIDANATTNHADLSYIKCYPGGRWENQGVSENSIVLIGSRAFSISGGGISNVKSLSGNLVPAISGIDTNVSSYTTPYGEYVLGFKYNKDYVCKTAANNQPLADPGANANLPSAIGIQFPDAASGYTNMIDINITGTCMTSASIGASIVKDINYRLSKYGFSGANAEINVSALVIDTGGNTATTDANDTVVIAASLPYGYTGINEAQSARFHLRDHTFVRVFNYAFNQTKPATQINDQNGTGTYMITIEANGSVGSSWVAWSVPVDEQNMTLTLLNVNEANVTTGVFAFNPSQDDNATIAFTSIINPFFDVKKNPYYDYAVNDYNGSFFTDVHPSAEANTSVLGAIRQVYTGTGLAGGTSYTTDNNASLGGAYLSDLMYNAVWSQNFPTALDSGPVYKLKESTANGGVDLQPENFITAVTEHQASSTIESEGNFISWKTIDITRDNNGSLDWFDKDYSYELFWTDIERGYWVYLTTDAGTAPTITTTATVTGSTLQHFHNDTNVTYNHVNKTFTVTIDNLINAADAAGDKSTTYNVVATIGGNKIPMMPSGTVDGLGDQFTIDLSDYYTPGFTEQQSTGSLTTISVTADDGLGEYATQDFTVDFVKPAKPTYSYSTATGLYTVTALDASEWRLYDKNMSDLNYSLSSTYTNHLVADDNNFTNQVDGDDTTDGTAELNMAATGYFTYPTATATSFYNALRLIAVDDQNLWSDMEIIYYAPVYQGTSILQDGGSTIDAQEYDYYPKKYFDTGAAMTNADDPDIDAGTGLLTHDEGVQLHAIEPNVTLTMAFQTSDNNNSRLDQDLARTKMLYIKDSSGTYCNTTISTETNLCTVGRALFMPADYAPSGAREVFYVYVDGMPGSLDGIYYGFFPDDDDEGFDGTQYLTKIPTDIQIVK